MMNENMGKDDEYVFPDDAGENTAADQFGYADDVPVNPQPTVMQKILSSDFFLNKRLVAAVVIVGAVALYLQFFSTGRNASVEKSAAPTVAKQAAEPQEKPLVQQVTSSVPPVEWTSMQSNLDQMKLQLSASKEQITQLTEQVESLNNQISARSSGQENLVDTVSALTTQIEVLNNKMVAMTKKPVKKIKKKITEYRISSIMPGRAWLIDRNGMTQTVAVGDKLAGYGKVTAVIPPRGQVYTSSGAVLKFGKNDS